MFKNRNQRVKFTPSNGDAIRLRCRVSLYEGRGEFQIIAEHLEHAGAGPLQAAFEQLKDKLLAEGLFESARKQPLPASIAHLGVVTSPTGAAIHDILTILKRRCPTIDVQLLPVPVQGEGAAALIAGAIDRANRWRKEGKIQLDALIIGRGGGSLEDRWAFNEEIVARAIAASELPIVSAVGHEVDFSIADMAADRRAATPSAAAELLSPDQHEWAQRLQITEGNLVRAIQRRLAAVTTHLAHLNQRLKHPGAQIRERAQRLDDLEQRLLLAQKHVSRRHLATLALLENRLMAKSPVTRLEQLQRETLLRRNQLEAAMRQRLQDYANKLTHRAQMLDSLSPLGTLQRGYAIVTDSSGAVVRETGSVLIGDEIEARVANGRLGLTVKRID